MARVAVRFLAYLAATWGTIGLLAAGLFPGAALVVLALALYSTVPLLLFLWWRGWPFYPGAAFRLVVVRPVLYAFLLLPFVSGAGLVGALAGAPFGAALQAGRAAAGVMLLVGAVVLAAGWVGSRSLVVREVEVAVPGLPAAFDGYRIAQLSDLHVGPHSSRRFLGRVVRAVTALAPDAIALTGDLVDDRSEDVPTFARAIAGLAAPDGIFVIPGNHDIYAGWDEVERGLRETGVGRILVNDAHVLRRGGASLALVGTGDPAGHGAGAAGPDLDLALARARAAAPGASVVALAHNPALWPALAERGVALTLSGHTHWGQLAIPSRGWSLASPFQRFAMGAHREGDALLYISPGTGYWGIPFRIGALPEVTLVRLRRAEESAVEPGEARAA